MDPHTSWNPRTSLGVRLTVHSISSTTCELQALFPCGGTSVTCATGQGLFIGAPASYGTVYDDQLISSLGLNFKLDRAFSSEAEIEALVTAKIAAQEWFIMYWYAPHAFIDSADLVRSTPLLELNN